MKKKLQRAAALFLTVLMMITALSVQGTAAAEEPTPKAGFSYGNYMKTGLQDIVATEITKEESEEIEAAIAHDYGREYNSGSDSVIIPNKYSGTHSEYSTDYFYNQMNSAEKQLYDNLYNAFSSFMTSNVDLSTVNFTDAVQYNPSLISDERLHIIYYVFYYSNPQFYFIGNGYSYYPGGGMVYPGVDDAFKSSSTRKEYSAAINSLTNSWLAEIRSADTQFERQCIIFRKLSEYITYGSSEHHQTIAGAFVEEECVCNGYAMATEYLCNAAGIDCIIAVSENHAWNIVKINGVWYEFDVTWIDHTDYGYLDYKWLNKSHDTFLANDEDNSHVYNTTTYLGFSLPACTVDMSTVYEDYSVYKGKITSYKGNDTDIVIPDDLYAAALDNYSFYNNANITSVEISESITGIGNYSFYNCSSLISVSIPSSVTSIGDGAFSGCNKLTAVNLPKSIDKIGDSMFYNCGALNEITLTGSVTSIGDYAFYGCSELDSIDIPRSVTSIGNYAFWNTGLTKINFAGSESEWEQMNVSDLPSGCTVIFADKTDTSANYGSASYSVTGDIKDYLNFSDKTASQYALVAEEKQIDSALTAAVGSTMSVKSVAGAKFEISLEKYSDNVLTGSVAVTAKPVSVTIELSSDLIKTGGSGVRDYTMIRIDKDSIEKIDTESDGTRLTFPVSKFGEYAIVYTDLAYGDVNGDSSVTLHDLLRLGKSISGVENTIIYKAAADVNLDGKITLHDLLRLGKSIAGIDGVVLGQAA